MQANNFKHRTHLDARPGTHPAPLDFSFLLSRFQLCPSSPFSRHLTLSKGI